MNIFVKSAVMLAVTVLASCSSLDGDKINYKSAGKGPSLDVPPDLTQLSRDSRYALGSGPVTASGYQGSLPNTGVPTAVSTLGDVRIERAGNQRWLVVDRPADKLWGPIRDFWQENGFLLTTDQAALGIMETDWAENRAKLPQDFIRSTIGKVLETFYSTGERDKFRTRIERNASGGTEIFISHRGMTEIYKDSQLKTETVWQPRAVDPELETEFLRRMMVKLGASPAQANAQVATASKTTSRVATVGNLPVVQIDEGFERAWRRLGLSLDRTGFTVEDRDRSQGTYFVRYIDPGEKKEPGFLTKLFSGPNAGAAPLKYRIVLRSQGDASTVSVLNSEGAPETSANAQRIVQVIADDLK